MVLAISSCCDEHVGVCSIKFILKLMTAAVAFRCQTNTSGSQVVSVRPMGWAVCMVIM